MSEVTLRKARESRGWDRPKVAHRLGLTVQQIAALEENRWQDLPGPVFVRGFIRNYAKLLEIDPEPLLGAMGESKATDRVIPEALENSIDYRWRSVLVSMAVLILLVLAILYSPIGYRDLQRGTASLMPDWLKEQPEQAAPAVQLPLASKRTGENTPTPAIIIPLPVSNITSVAPTVSSSEPRQQPAVSSPSSRTRISNTLALHFTDEAWVEVSDASGKQLLRKLAREGEILAVNGTPPYKVIMGNAPAVKIHFRDAEVPIPGKTHGQVVHLVVGEGAPTSG